MTTLHLPFFDQAKTEEEAMRLVCSGHPLSHHIGKQQLLLSSVAPETATPRKLFSDERLGHNKRSSNCTGIGAYNMVGGILVSLIVQAYILGVMIRTSIFSEGKNMLKPQKGQGTGCSPREQFIVGFV